MTETTLPHSSSHSQPVAASAALSRGEPRIDPLGPVMAMGREQMWAGGLIGGGIAALAHGYLVVRVLMALIAMGAFVGEAREEAHAFFWASYEIDTTPAPSKPAPKEEEPPPEIPPPDQDPPPQAAALPKPDEIYKEQPAAKPALAPDLVTAAADSQAPEQFYDVVDHDGSKGASTGVVSAKGEGNDIVRDPKARIDGQKGGTGTGPAAPPPPKVDKSRPPTLSGSTSWSCPFPPEADAEGRDSAVATVVVTVRPDGTPQAVSVVADPGSGFGRAARKCALGRRYSAGLDKDGQATTANTPPIRVKFSR